MASKYYKNDKAEPAHKKLHVLIVDDNPIFLKIWEKVFRLIGNCDYRLTNDPDAVKAIAREGKIDLLISGVVMEKENGFKLAEVVHKNNPKADIILSTTYNCDLKRFNLNDPKFHILYKPYRKIDDVIQFVTDIINKEDPRDDKSIDEDSWSENEAYPSVMEWKL
jgi:DNA-binding NtrC family response regulator